MEWEMDSSISSSSSSSTADQGKLALEMRPVSRAVDWQLRRLASILSPSLSFSFFWHTEIDPPDWHRLAWLEGCQAYECPTSICMRVLETFEMPPELMSIKASWMRDSSKCRTLRSMLQNVIELKSRGNLNEAWHGGVGEEGYSSRSVRGLVQTFNRLSSMNFQMKF